MTSEDSNNLQIHFKVLTFQILFSFRAVKISEIAPKFFIQSEVIEDRGWSILSKSIIRHQDQFVGCPPMTSEDFNSLQIHSKLLTFQILFSSRVVNMSEIVQSFSPNPEAMEVMMTLSCQNQSLEIKTSSQRCLPLTSDDSKGLHKHSKLLKFQILFSSRAVNMSRNRPKFFGQS